MESHHVYDQCCLFLTLRISLIPSVFGRTRFVLFFGGTLPKCKNPWGILENGKASTYLSSDLIFVPIQLLCTKWVTKVKPDINSVEVHPQLSHNKHPVDGCMVQSGPHFTSLLRMFL
jgi:hypothetical protein